LYNSIAEKLPSRLINTENTQHFGSKLWRYLIYVILNNRRVNILSILNTSLHINTSISQCFVKESIILTLFYSIYRDVSTYTRFTRLALYVWPSAAKNRLSVHQRETGMARCWYLRFSGRQCRPRSPSLSGRSIDVSVMPWWGNWGSCAQLCIPVTSRTPDGLVCDSVINRYDFRVDQFATSICKKSICIHISLRFSISRLFFFRILLLS